MDNRPIGVMDSGIGGLTVAKALKAAYPKEGIVFLGDTKRNPYGERTKEEIVDFSFAIKDFLLKKQVKMILIACNTISFNVPDSFFAGDVPVVKMSMDVKVPADAKRFAVFATPATIKTHAHKAYFAEKYPQLDFVEVPCDGLAAAIEQTMVSKRYRRIIATRSVQGLDQEIGFLPGTEAEKMEPWLGAITDNLEALHMDDESTHGSVDYILQKVPLQFKSLNYIRGRSFQQSLILIDECQNLTPHQMKTIITRAGSGSKVICLGNLAQIDTPYLSAPSSGLTYLTERFKGFAHGVHLTLQGVPRSVLAEYAESHM